MSQSPEEFGKYTLLRRVAFGGMAEIFLAAMRGDKGFEKKVILKRILPQFGGDPSFVNMFIDEAVIAARLTHPNVVQIYDFGDVDGVYFIAMEYVEGADLRRILREAEKVGRRLSFAEVAAMGEGICRGLSYAHGIADDRGKSLKLVHRDISPHNVMVSRSGEAKVMDFGIAKAEERATKTATGMIKGKVAYMAPEQAAGEVIDKRADQFAVGLVLWEATTGERLFTGESDLEMLKQVTECRTRPVSEVRTDTPEALESIIMRALSPAVDQRYDDLHEMEQALQRFRFSLGPDGAVSLGDVVDELIPPPPPTGPVPERRTRAVPDSGGTAAQAPPDATVATAGWSGGDEQTAATRSEELSARAPTQAPTPAPALEVLDEPVGPPPAAAGAGEGASRTAWILAAAAALAALTMVLLVVVFSGDEAVPPPAVTEVAVAAPATTLEITSQPPGAAIKLGGVNTGLRTPASLPDQARGSLAISLSLPGYTDWSQTLALVAPEQRIHGTLQIAAAAPLVVAAAPAAPEVESPPHTQPASRAPRKAKARRKPAAAGTGWVSLRTTGPWVEVYHGKKKLGTTPLRKVEMPAGKVKLKLVNADEGIKKMIVVQVTAEQELRKTVSFE